MSKVSVIMPTYNREAYISEAIQSVLNQTYSDFELLIIDDASTDNTKEIINNFIRNDPRIHYLMNNGKKGVSSARNTGFKHSKGKFITFLDSDDCWNIDNLKLKIEILNTHPDIDAILSDTSVFGEVEEKYISRPHIMGIFNDKLWDRRNKIFSIAKSSIIPFILKHGFSFRTPTLVFRKELLSKTGNFNEEMIFFEDADFMFRCFCVGKFGYLNKKLCQIRRHAFNTHNIYNKNIKAESELLFIKNEIDYVIKHNLNIKESVLKSILRDAYIRRATLWFKEGNLNEVKKCILESIKIKPCLKAILRLVGIYILLHSKIKSNT